MPIAPFVEMAALEVFKHNALDPEKLLIELIASKEVRTLLSAEGTEWSFMAGGDVNLYLLAKTNDINSYYEVFWISGD